MNTQAQGRGRGRARRRVLRMRRRVGVLFSSVSWGCSVIGRNLLSISGNQSVSLLRRALPARESASSLSSSPAWPLIQCTPTERVLRWVAIRRSISSIIGRLLIGFPTEVIQPCRCHPAAHFMHTFTAYLLSDQMLIGSDLPG